MTCRSDRTTRRAYRKERSCLVAPTGQPSLSVRIGRRDLSVWIDRRDFSVRIGRRDLSFRKETQSCRSDRTSRSKEQGDTPHAAVKENRRLERIRRVMFGQVDKLVVPNGCSCLFSQTGGRVLPLRLIKRTCHSESSMRLVYRKGSLCLVAQIGQRDAPPEEVKETCRFG